MFYSDLKQLFSATVYLFLYLWRMCYPFFAVLHGWASSCKTLSFYSIFIFSKSFLVRRIRRLWKMSDLKQ